MASSVPLRLPWLGFRPLRPSIASWRINGTKACFSSTTLQNDVAPSYEQPTSNLATADNSSGSTTVESKSHSDGEVRIPRNVQAIYLRPLRRDAEYGVPSCDLQMRSYSVRNLEFFADFALRAAYYLHLPAFGPIPLPRITERWTVPKSHFIFKKSQENFERVTLRRLIQIKDGHPETVELWLAFLRKHSYYGIGMKANIWEYTELGVGKSMDTSLENLKGVLQPKWAHFGRRKHPQTSEKVMEVINSKKYRANVGLPELGHSLESWTPRTLEPAAEIQHHEGH